MDPWKTNESNAMLKENEKIAEKLNEIYIYIFASVFREEDRGHIPETELTFAGRQFEELRQIVMRDQVRGLIGKIKTNKTKRQAQMASI